MAVTVEELQILLSCDASQAEKALGQINELVDKVAKKISKTVSNSSQRGSNSGGLQAQARRISQDLKKENPAEAIKKSIDRRASSLGKSLVHGMDLEHRFKESLTKASNKLDFSGFGTKEDRYRNIPDITPSASQRVPYKPPKDSYYDPKEMARLRAETMQQIAGLEGNSNPYNIDTEKLVNGTPLEKLGEQLSIAMARVDELKAKLDSALSGGKGSDKIASLGNQLTTAQAKVEKIAAAMDKLEVSTGSGAAKSIEETGNAASNATPKVERLNRAVSKGRKGVGIFNSVFGHFGKSFHKNQGFLSKFGATLKRVIMRMMAMGLIRGVINGFVQGMKILGNASSEAQKKFGQFTAMSNSVKAALGSVALSVLTALAPLLYNIASAAITAANALARFFAMFGSGTYFAVSMADGFDNVESAAKGAGGAAKGALAAFDELNVIGNKGGGGGGGSADIGNTEIKSMTAESLLADLLKKGQFEEAGNLVSENLGIVADKIGAWFDSLSSQHYGAKFAQFLNGIFGNSAAFNKIGTMVGKGCNLIINTAFDAVTTFDAPKAAKSLAGAINSAITTIEWKKIGATLGVGLLDAIEFVVNFIKTINWGQLVKSITDAAFEALKAILSNPQRLVRLIKDLALGVIDILGGLVFGGIGGIIEGLSTFFPALKGVGDQIAQGWDDTMNELDQILDDQIDKMSESWGTLGDASEETAGRAAGALKDQGNEVDLLGEKYKELYGIINGVGSSGGAMSSLVTNQREYGYALQGNISAIENLRKKNQQYIQDDNFPQAKINLDKAKSSTDANATAFGKLSSSASSAASSISKVVDKIKNAPDARSIKLTVNLTAIVKATGAASTTIQNPNMPLKIEMFARGGVVYGDTLARIGEYKGAKSNPEVVAPLSDLSKILQNTGNNKANERSMNEQNELLRQQNSLLTAILNKELTLSPSPALGQVMSQSAAMFART